MPETKISDPRATASVDTLDLAVDLAGLQQAIDGICARIDQLLAERASLLQLLREARELLDDQETELNLIDWLKAAAATLAQAEGRS